MQLEALKVYCDIVRLQSFSKGAAANGLTQSAASQIVHMLEDRLKTQLIDRSTRPLHPTHLGQVFYDGCRNVVETYNRLELQVQRGEVPEEASIEVASIYSIGMGDLGQLKEQFEQDHPQTEVHIDYLHPGEVYECVHEGSVDFGLVSFPRKDRGLKSQLWREDRMVVACRPDHPFAEDDEVSPDELSGQRYVAFERGLAIRRQVDKFLREIGASVVVECELDNIGSIKEAIVHGKAGIALLPEPTLHQEIRAGSLVARPLQGRQLYRPLSILYSRHHPLSQTAQRFIDLLRKHGHTALQAAQSNSHEVEVSASAQS